MEIEGYMALSKNRLPQSPVSYHCIPINIPYQKCHEDLQRVFLYFFGHTEKRFLAAANHPNF